MIRIKEQLDWMIETGLAEQVVSLEKVAWENMLLISG
jgi:hypothetical protein